MAAATHSFMLLSNQCVTHRSAPPGEVGQLLAAAPLHRLALLQHLVQEVSHARKVCKQRRSTVAMNNVGMPIASTPCRESATREKSVGCNEMLVNVNSARMRAGVMRRIGRRSQRLRSGPRNLATSRPGNYPKGLAWAAQRPAPASFTPCEATPTHRQLPQRTQQTQHPQHAPASFRP